MGLTRLIKSLESSRRLMDPANERAKLPPNPDVIEHEDGTIEYRGMIIKPAKPIMLPDAKKITPNTHKDIKNDVVVDEEYRRLLTLYFNLRIEDELSKNPDHIKNCINDFYEAIGYEKSGMTRDSILNNDIKDNIKKFNKSWSHNKVTDAHVRFYYPLKGLQDRIRDLVEKATRWSAERYDNTELIFRGTDENELISIVDGSWSTSKEGQHGDWNYRFVSTNIYVARGYAKSKDASKLRIILIIPKDILVENGYLISPEYVGNAAGIAVAGREAQTKKRWAYKLGLEEHFLLKNIDIDSIKSHITIGVVGNVDEDRLERFKKEYEGKFAGIVRIPETGEAEW